MPKPSTGREMEFTRVLMEPPDGSLLDQSSNRSIRITLLLSLMKAWQLIEPKKFAFIDIDEPNKAGYRTGSHPYFTNGNLWYRHQLLSW